MANKSDRRSTESSHISDDRRSGRERRKFERLVVDLPVDYGANDTFLYSLISDFSAMGIFIKTTSPQPTGTKLHLRFTPPGQSKPLELEGKVTWINPVHQDNDPQRQPGMGIQFLNVTETQKKQLQQVVQTLALLDEDFLDSPT